MLLSVTMTSTRLRWAAVVAAGIAFLALVVGCTSPDDAPVAAGPGADAALADGDAAQPDGLALDTGGADVVRQDAEAGVAHPCTTAPEIPMGGRLFGSLNASAGHIDYYRLRAAAGDILRISLASSDPLESLVSRVLTLYDETGTTLRATSAGSSAVAWREGYPASIWGVTGELRSAGNNPSLRYRPMDDEALCVGVMDRSTWLGQPRNDLPVIDYKLSVLSVSGLADIGQACLDTEPNDTALTAQRLDDCGDATSLIWTGSLDGKDDVDVMRLAVADGTGLVNIRFDPPGPGGPGVDGSGSTLQLAPVDLTDEAGHVLARADPALGVHELYAYVPVGQDALLSIRRAPGTDEGANDFYFMWGGTAAPGLLNRFGENETAAGENDTPDTAQTGHASIDSIFGFAEWGAVGSLHETAPGEPVDVDYWAMSGYPEGRLELRCWSARIGSGVIDAEFAILDSQGNVLREGVETKDRDFDWRDDPLAVAPPLDLPDDDTYYLRVTAAGQDPEVSSRAYVCGVDFYIP